MGKRCKQWQIAAAAKSAPFAHFQKLDSGINNFFSNLDSGIFSLFGSALCQG